MVSRCFSGFVCVLFVFVVPTVWATFCHSYWDKAGYFHDIQPCFMFCCGDCTHRYCCSDRKDRLTKENQDLCLARSAPSKINKNPVLVVGSILGTLFPFIICVGMIICCLAPCCWCYKNCRKGRRRRHTAVVNTTVVHALPEPSSPEYRLPYSAYQPSYPGHVGAPVPTAPPPSYQESMNQAHSPVNFSQGQVMYNPHQHPSQLYSDECVQPPFNPSYQLNHYAG
ncbi:protein shisa-4-like isoform X2 [Parambassis ranga]|uniref:Protein shisa-4-like isoform X2 n=1 Tax=Parambassis ranga TaxID=210632 RepID=A0A6P7ICX5_9TELE|nr:protein shisa-4-like isoform X2 [Parambassis ranga]